MATFVGLPASAKEQPRPSNSKFAFLSVIVVVGVIVRVAWRLYKGDQDFWTNGSSLFYELATNLAAGAGIGLEPDGRAVRLPVYPLFLALLAGKSYLWIVIPEALLGAGTVLCAYAIGKELFGVQVAIIAAIITALYPYYVFNDTSLYETSLCTFLTALSIFLLLRARRSAAVTQWTLAGLVLGAVVLTSETLLPFAAVALIWTLLLGEGSLHRKFDRVVGIAAPLCLLTGLWAARNYMTLGSPVMTSSFGRQLWDANNPQTFSHYPEGTFGRSSEDALLSLTPEERQDLEGISDEVLKSTWFEDKALDYMTAHPADTLLAAGRKIVAGFSWNLTPEQEPVVRISYFVSYGAISILGVVGILLTRRRWKELSLIYLLFISFVAVTAVLWAQTRQRSYLDVYWIIFAAYVLSRIFGSRSKALPAREPA